MLTLLLGTFSLVMFLLRTSGYNFRPRFQGSTSHRFFSLLGSLHTFLERFSSVRFLSCSSETNFACCETFNMFPLQPSFLALLPQSTSPRGRHGNPFQYSCPEKPHGQRSLAGYSPQGRKELDMTEVTQQAFKHRSKRFYVTKSRGQILNSLSHSLKSCSLG